MKIKINKVEQELNDGMSLKQVLEQVPNIPQSGIAVAVNGDVVPKTDWDSRTIADGDAITVIRAFYGG
ncbi:MAG: sulfur carrier protein ThiS [Muribaculaceae bacterium]